MVLVVLVGWKQNWTIINNMWVNSCAFRTVWIVIVLMMDDLRIIHPVGAPSLRTGPEDFLTEPQVCLGAGTFLRSVLEV